MPNERTQHKKPLILPSQIRTHATKVHEIFPHISLEDIIELFVKHCGLSGDEDNSGNLNETDSSPGENSPANDIMVWANKKVMNELVHFNEVLGGRRILTPKRKKKVKVVSHSNANTSSSTDSSSSSSSTPSVQCENTISPDDVSASDISMMNTAPTFSHSNHQEISNNSPITSTAANPSIFSSSHYTVTEKETNIKEMSLSQQIDSSLSGLPHVNSKQQKRSDRHHLDGKKSRKRLQDISSKSSSHQSSKIYDLSATQQAMYSFNFVDTWQQLQHCISPERISNLLSDMHYFSTPVSSSLNAPQGKCTDSNKEHLQETNKNELDTFFQNFKDVIRKREYFCFSNELLQISSLLREELLHYAKKNETSASPSIKIPFDPKLLVQMDGHLKKHAQMDTLLKNTATKITGDPTQVSISQLNTVIADRNQLREQCLHGLRYICHQLEQVIENYSHQQSRLLSIKALCEKFISKHQKNNSNPIIGPSTSPHFSDENKVLSYFKWYTQIEAQVKACIGKTNEAYKTFKSALEEEKRVINNILHNGGVPFNNICTDIYAVGINLSRDKEIVEFSRKYEHIKQLQAYYFNNKREFEIKLKSKGRAEQLPALIEEARTKYRESKRNLLKFRYRKEEMEIDGASEKLIREVEKDMTNAQQTVVQWERTVEALEREVQELSSNGYPEVEITKCTSSADSIIPNRILDSKLEVKRSIKDYQIVRYIGKRVLIVSYAGKLHVLKQFPITNGDNRKNFLKEINALMQLQHPCVAKIESFFREDQHIYLQMEYYEAGHMKEWFNESKRSEQEIRSIFHLIAQALKYIHDKGIIHCDIKLENIVLCKFKHFNRMTSLTEQSVSYRPILIDFDISRDITNPITVTTSSNQSTNTSIGFTIGCAAPEVMDFVNSSEKTSQGKKEVLSPAIDIWAFGIMLYRLTFPQVEPILLPEKDGIEIPNHENAYLMDLLRSILKKDPSQRISADELIVHPYFTVDYAVGVNCFGLYKQKDGNRKTEAKIEAFHRFLFHLKQNFKSQNSKKLILRIHRNNLVNNVLHIFDTLNPELQGRGLLQSFRVEFVGETGYDIGGLLTNLYTDFFRQVVAPSFKLFEQCEESKLALPYCTAVERCDNQKFNATIQGYYRAIGKALAKCIYDQRVIPQVFPPSFFKYLLNQEDSINFRDLEIYDPQLALHLNKMMCQTGIDSWGLDFSEFENEPDQSVTDENKAEYVMKKTKHVLLMKRSIEMQAIKEGFQSFEELKTQLKVFGAHELMILLHGQDYVDPNAILDRCTFEEFTEQSKTPQHFQNIISEMNQIQLRQFLEFVTGQCGLQTAGEQKQIVVRCVSSNLDSLPVSHVCGFVLDIPDYGDQNILKQKLLQAFDHIEHGTGFHFV